MHPFDIDFKILNLNFDSVWIVRVLPVALRDLKRCQTDLRCSKAPRLLAYGRYESFSFEATALIDPSECNYSRC